MGHSRTVKGLNMSVESGCLVFCSSRGDAWCSYLLSVCILLLRGFLLWFCYGMVFFSCPLSFGHGCIQSLVFQSHRTSHLRTYSITIRHFHVSFVKFYRITHVFICSQFFVACTGPVTGHV